MRDTIFCVLEVSRLSLKLSDSDKEYLDALKAKRLSMLKEKQSYRIGSRAAAEFQIALRDLTAEINALEGATTPRFRRAVPIR